MDTDTRVNWGQLIGVGLGAPHREQVLSATDTKGCDHKISYLDTDARVVLDREEVVYDLKAVLACRDVDACNVDQHFVLCRRVILLQ